MIGCAAKVENHQLRRCTIQPGDEGGLAEAQTSDSDCGQWVSF